VEIGTNRVGQAKVGEGLLEILDKRLADAVNLVVRLKLVALGVPRWPKNKIIINKNTKERTSSCAR